MVENKPKNFFDAIPRLPARLLKPAYLVGKVPYRACRSDPRVSYTLYVPPKQYCEVHEALQTVTAAESIRRLPLIINVHGTRRDASLSRDSLVDFADKLGVAVLAPLFPAGLDGPTDIDNFKALRSKTLKADLVLLDILNEVKHIWAGIQTDQVTLIGWSGGGQFAHRFAYFHPGRLSALVVGAPGRTTNIIDEPWPTGLASVGQKHDGLVADVDGLRRVKHIFMVVGGDDLLPEGADELRKLLAKVEPEKANVLKDILPRRDFLQQLHSNWQEHGIEAEFELVPGVGHSYTDILPVIVAWLEKCAIFQQWLAPRLLAVGIVR